MIAGADEVDADADAATVPCGRAGLFWYEYAAALTPLVLVATMGALGLAVGPAGAAVNLIIARRIRGYALASASLVVAGVSFLVWAGLVVALR